MAFRDFALSVAAGLGCTGLIVLLRPLLMRYALARPNARSSHKVPTPQGGGLAVATAALVALGCFGALFADAREALGTALPLGAAVVALTAVGAVDDILSIGALPRLALQAVAVTTAVLTMPAELRVVPLAPFWVERAAEIFAGVWFVNLMNFMDGIDWMTVAETVPIAATLSWLALGGAVPQPAGWIAVVLLGAILGFAPFNRPVAKLFLGDVGSLPIGLVLFWLLLQLATTGHLVAAVLLPLYYVADATLTLLWRAARREPILQAHRSHFYQVATVRGLSVRAVVGLVFAVDVALAGLAVAAIDRASLPFDLFALALGGALVAALLYVMARGVGR